MPDSIDQELPRCSRLLKIKNLERRGKNQGASRTLRRISNARNANRQTCRDEQRSPAAAPGHTQDEPALDEHGAGHTEQGGAGDSEGRASSGKPLDPVTRTFFEMRFSEDLGDVRVRPDASPQSSSGRFVALAHTVGSNISFRKNLYAPSTPLGRLLGHELAPIIQQRRENGTGDSAELESEAWRAADIVVAGGSASVSAPRLAKVSSTAR